MNIFKKIFGKKAPITTEEEQALIVRFKYDEDSLEKLHSVEELLNTKIDNDGVGEYDGHDITADLSGGALYMYGPSADKLFGSVKSILESTDFIRGATATLRYGPPEEGVAQKDLIIKSEQMDPANSIHSLRSLML